MHGKTALQGLVFPFSELVSYIDFLNEIEDSTVFVWQMQGSIGESVEKALKKRGWQLVFIDFPVFDCA